MNKIFAISSSANINRIIGNIINLNVHSRFKNGLNLIGENGLVFIGTRKNGELPFGIHLNDEDLFNLIDNESSNDFIWNREYGELTTDKFTINLSKSRIYDSHLNIIKDSDIDDSINFLKDTLINLSDNTGFDESIKNIISHNRLFNDLRTNLNSNNEKNIEDCLRRIIGLGKGLTPSGDDFLVGLLWVNRIRPLLGDKLYTTLKRLIILESLTTDISINYYKEAFEGNFSSPLINLYNLLINYDELKIKSGIIEVIKCGHTSGIDTLSGIAFGVEYLLGGN